MPLTICHISTTFVSKSGSARRTFRMLCGLREAGYRPVNITGAAHEPDPGWDMTGIEQVVIPNMHKHVSLWNDVVTFVKLIRALRRIKPDIVHTHLAKAGFVGRIAAKLCGVPLILHTVHGPTFPKSIGRGPALIYRSMEKLAALFTDKFVFVGEELKQEFIDAGAAVEDRSVIILTGRPDAELAAAEARPPSERAAYRAEWDTPSDAFALACVGRLVPSKDQKRAIDALVMLRERGVNAVLWLIGEAHVPKEQAYRIELIEHAKKLGVEEHVRFTGYQADVLGCMAAAEVVIMTSKYEGLPNVAVEAGIAARPFVALRVSGLAETIIEGGTGHVVDQDDVAGLVDRLEALARDPEAVQRMGEAARAHIRGSRSAEVMVATKLKLYEELAAKHAMSGPVQVQKIEAAE